MSRIALFGYNNLSYDALTRLDTKDCDILVVEQDEEAVIRAQENGLNVVSIDYRNDEDLKAIGIGGEIETLFCFFEEDCENVFLTISARAIDKKLNIISIVENPGAAEKLLAAGANKIIDPYEICGRKIHELVKKPEITNILDHTVFGRHDLNIAQIEITPGSSLENVRASELELNQRYNLILIAVVDKELGEELHFVVGEKDHNLDAGDTLVVLGPSREIRNFKKQVEAEVQDDI